MKGLYFYKLSSPYQEDVTKDCKLTINEIDHNFITLKNTDVKDINFDEETGLLTLSQINGDEFVTKIDLSHFTKDFRVEWDSEKSALIFHYDDKEVVIDELVSTIVDNSITNIVEEIISQTITDNTLIGVGVGQNPLGINPLEIPGTYKAVERLINKLDGEYLPNEEQLKKGDRFLSYEKLNLYGNLYNYDAVKKINEDLKNGWRVPTKEDWDNMLNAIELCDFDKNHQSKICNVDAGKYAGKLLKYGEYWKLNESNGDTLVTCDDGCMVCEGDEPSINPLSTKGVDSYGFSILPAGYGDGYANLNYMGEQTEFWTSTETERTDVYTKRFYYNKSSIVQIAETPKSLCSLRLVKDYNGNNFKGVETVNGINYRTVLMPSANSKFGYAIWLASNVAFDEERYNPVLPNNGEVLMNETAYYINEWNGFHWLKKEFINGDSVVIKVGPDGDNNREYQLIDGKLINIKRDLRNELLEIVSELDCETIENEGDYIASISEENGVVTATTKQLVQTHDKLLSYNVDGISSSIDLLEDKNEKEEGVKKVYKLIDKNQEIIGHPIIIDESVTNETYVSTNIPVAGGPLADLVAPTTTEIKAGTNLQDLLFTLFCKEKYPTNPRFNYGSIAATISQPTFNVYKASTTTQLNNNVEVEVGTLVDINAIVSQKTNYTITPSTWTGFDFGYSVENDNSKDGNSNPKNLNNTIPSQVSTYSLKRTFGGFDNKVFTQTSESNNDNTKVKVDKLSNVTIADGNNTITSSVTGATFQTTFTDDILAYYVCSNLGKTTSENFVSGETHNRTTNVPTNSYSINIKGMRYSFVGTFDNTNFTPSSESVRNLTKYAFSKANTKKVTAPAGKKCVVIAYPKEWGKLTKIEDVNSMHAPIQENFTLYEVNVNGANNYTPKTYYVYVNKSSVTLGAIDYNLYF